MEKMSILFFATFCLVIQCSQCSTGYILRSRSNNDVDLPIEKESKIITDDPKSCVYVTSETGKFTYRSSNTDATVCGIYLMADAQDQIKVTFTKFDVPCNNSSGIGSLVQYLDGWELRGEVFPSLEDASIHPIEDTEFCSDNTPFKREFVSSQNGALISYRITEIGKGFTISVEHERHHDPCNVIHVDEQSITLRNHGKAKNCSIWAPYPTAFTLSSYSVGQPDNEARTQHKCSKSEDQIEIGGGGLDINRIEVLDLICNDKNDYDGEEKYVICTTTTIKLVSHGGHDNYANISLRPLMLDQASFAEESYTCKLPQINS